MVSKILASSIGTPTFRAAVFLLLIRDLGKNVLVVPTREVWSEGYMGKIIWHSRSSPSLTN